MPVRAGPPSSSHTGENSRGCVNLSCISTGTKSLILHRLSTIRKADFIIVLQEGRVAERGTHDELMARRGLYHALVHTQTKEMDELVENEEEEEHFETLNEDDDESGEHYNLDEVA